MAFLALFLKETLKTLEVIFHIPLGTQEVIRLALAIALFVAHTKEISVC